MKDSNLQKRITVLMILLIIIWFLLNVITFWIYTTANADQGFYERLWEYMKSDIFNILLVSVVLPLLMFLIEKQFKFIEAARNRRADIHQKLMDERREKRIEAVNLTIEMYDNLFNITSGVVHQPYHEKARDRKVNWNRVIEEMRNFTSTASSIVNTWYFRLKIPYDVEETYLNYVNLMLNSALSVSMFLERCDDPEEADDLQDSLRVIQDGVTHAAQMHIISALKLQVSLLDNNYDSDKESTKDLNNLEYRHTSLRSWWKSLKNLSAQFNIILPEIGGQEAEDFRKLSDEYSIWKRNNVDKPDNQFEKFNELISKFDAIPRRQLVDLGNILYSRDFIRKLADWFNFELIFDEAVQGRV